VKDLAAYERDKGKAELFVGRRWGQADPSPEAMKEWENRVQRIEAIATLLESIAGPS
jgi:hypothetical protein